jgi:hypothetical protein
MTTDNLRDVLAEVLCGAICEGDAPAPIPGADNPRHRIAACYEHQRGADALAPTVARLIADARAEAEVAGQMRHISAEVARGDVPLADNEELIADLRARVSHVEAERDLRHNAWAQSVKNEAALHREIEAWRRDAERLREQAAADRARIEAVLAEPDDVQWWPVTPYMDPSDDDEVVEVQVVTADRLRAALDSEGGA